jgi:acyl carrier protein
MGRASRGLAQRRDTVTEEAVLRIVAEVLHLPRVTGADSFYDFGGTSLQAMRICARLRKDLGVHINPEAFFSSDTMADVLAMADSQS